MLYPGHLYAADPFASMGEVRSSNFVYRLRSLEQWRMYMGG